MSNNPISDNQRDWPEGATPVLQCTLVDSSGTAIALANINSLTLTQWIDNGSKPATIINSRKLQNVLNANNVTVNSTTGLVTWNLQAADTTMQSKDYSVLEERHWFRFDLSYTAGGATILHSGPGKNGPDYYVVHRKQVTN
jgi:hypothetical protein